MPTFKQTYKSIQKANNAIKREQKKRSQEAAKQFKEQQKQQEIADASEAVRKYNTYIDSITTLHKNASENLFWNEILEEEQPVQPELSNKNESMAQLDLDNFSPNLIEKVFGAKRKLKKLKDQVKIAVERDKKEFQEAEQEFANWKEIQIIGKGVLNKDPKEYQHAFEFFKPFDDIQEIGATIKARFEPEIIEIEVLINSDEVIPNFILSQTKSGKLSKKDMPKGKMFELFQDYVCSTIIRVARETLSFVPVQKVIVHGLVEGVNSQTGHTEEQTIVSAVFDPEILDTLNMDLIDPSDSMENFVCNMKFKKTKGFELVDKIDTSHGI